MNDGEFMRVENHARAYRINTQEIDQGFDQDRIVSVVLVEPMA